ncbi:MAG: helix-turn-helix transcriptional regulator [Synergistaceae bacterium]|nr:helix-turn-helix transcriptional regulator [Synergistaceae bacterium]
MICIQLKLEENQNAKLFHKKIRKDFYSTNTLSFAIDKIPNNENLSIFAVNFHPNIDPQKLLDVAHLAKSKNPNCKIILLGKTNSLDFLNLIFKSDLIDGHLNFNFFERIPQLLENNSLNYSDQKSNLLKDILTMEYINDLIYNHMERANRIKPLLDILKVNISPQMIMTIICDDFWQICEQLDNSKRYNIKRNILNATRKAIAKKMNAISTTLIGTDKIVVILDCEGKNNEDAETYGIECANFIRSKIMEITGYSVSIGLSRYCHNKNNLWKAYEESFQALKQVFFYGKNSILLYRHEHNMFSGEQNENKEMILHQKIIAKIFLGDNKLIEDVINEIISILKVEKNKEMEVKSKIVIIIAKITHYFEKVKLDDFYMLDRQSRLIVSIFKATSLKEVQELVKKYVFDISKIVNVAKNKDSKISMEMSLSFMKEFYYEDLKLKDIANMAGYSTSYFSRTFSDTFEASFIETLVNIRIKHAEVLLKKYNLTISEISERVGFKNSSYFSVAFKKKTGLSPIQYRNFHVEKGKSEGSDLHI